MTENPEKPVQQEEEPKKPPKKPDQNVKPPIFDIVTEDLDLSKAEKRGDSDKKKE